MFTMMGKGAEKAIQMLQKFHQDFPHTFIPPGKEVRPLKVGIRKDLVKFYQDRLKELILEFDLLDEIQMKKIIKDAVGMYCGAYRYSRAVMLGVERIDLNGNDAGKPEEKHVQRAKEDIVKHQEKKKRKQLKRKQLAAKEKSMNKKAKTMDAEKDHQKKEVKTEQIVGAIKQVRKNNNRGKITAETLGFPKLELKLKSNSR